MDRNVGQRKVKYFFFYVIFSLLVISPKIQDLRLSDFSKSSEVRALDKNIL